jgi:alpha-L-rhamnosidase
MWIFAGVLAVTASPAEAVSKAVRLQCEYRSDPIGIDVARPRLSWWVEDSRRGARQTAYQILVAGSPERLTEQRADIWNSGKRQGDQSLNVLYGGPRLSARRNCWWTVRLWDMNGNPGPWSRPARFEIGLLNRDEWKARWIGVPGEENAGKIDLSGVQWIWHDRTATTASGPSGVRTFAKRFEIPAGRKIASAELMTLADNLYQHAVNGNHAGAGGGWQMLSPVSVAKWLKPGPNILTMIANNTDGPAGLASLLVITFEDGSIQRVVSDGSWKSTVDPGRTWTDASLNPDAWQTATVLAPMGSGPWGTPRMPGRGGPATLVRKEFPLRKPIRSARAYVTALGTYRLHINGRRVGSDILTPDWTDYRKRVLYQTYDVTSHLQNGTNAIAAMVGDGWYSSGLGFALERNIFGPPPNRFLCQLHVDYEDGSGETIVTDGTWKSAVGPILRSEIYAGETYDARREPSGWDRAGFTDTAWKPVTEFAWPEKTVISAQNSPTIQVTEERKPKSFSSPANNVWVADMGQNMVGWCRLRVDAPAGTRIRLRFAERLEPDGNIYTENLRMAEATDTYICRGGGEVWEPHFTYHGFRYVEITGLPAPPSADTIVGRVFHTNVPRLASLRTSSPLVNQLYSNITWSSRSNLHSVPTDCPQRDERLGWLGDAEIYWPTMTFTNDVASFTRKWMRDVVEAQSEAGGFPDVAPRCIDLSDGAPAWGDAGILVPYYAYRMYNDIELLRENYPAMQKWIEYIRSANPDWLWLKRRNNDFGDWVPANSTTDKDLIATCYYAYDCRLMAEIAEVLDKPKDAAMYKEMYGKIRSALAARFIQPDGRIANGSQTCYAMPIAMGLLTPEEKAKAAAWLAKDIMEDRKGFLSTGFVGTAYLMTSLTESGRNDVAYKLLLNELYPSWGYMISKGATSMWERWNGDTGDPAMNSYNHYSFGAVGEWMFRCMAGIDRTRSAPGLRTIAIRPNLDPRITHVAASYDSVSGPISVEWRGTIKDGYTVTVNIPANTTATITLQAGSPAEVTEGGRAVGNGADLRFLQTTEDGRQKYFATAGTWRFRVNPGK